MDIRGYGPVKDAAVKTVKARVTQLLESSQIQVRAAA